MAGSRIPAALRNRLGDDATVALIELLDSEHKERSEHVLSVAADRFERRLTEEIATLRVELRQALHDGLAAVRDEVHAWRQSLVQEIASARVDMLKWGFLFWIGQVAAMAAVLALMFRITGR